MFLNAAEKKASNRIKNLVGKPEVFDTVMEGHNSPGHGGQKKKKRLFFSYKYMNITQKVVSYFISNGETLKRTKYKPNKRLVVRPLKT